MDVVRVGVQAADLITFTALVSYLQTRHEVVVVDPAELTDGDVMLVQADRITPHAMSRLQDERLAAVPKVLLVGEVKEIEVLSAVEGRVVAVLSRSRTSGDQLVEAIVSAASGSGVFPPDLLGRLLDGIRLLQQEVLSPRGLGAAGLTSREIDILRLVADGRDTSEIAEALCYSERTVKKVIFEMTSRLNLRNRSHAVAHALQAGVI